MFALAAMSIGLAYGCDCRAPSVDVAVERAEVVFRGSIIEFRPASKQSEIAGMGKDTKTTAVFRVTRVWKGEVGQTFEMPAIEETSACWGFWPSFLKLGSELIVYAGRFQGGEYVTSVCSRTQLVKDAKNDLKELGPGEEPKSSGLRKSK